MVYLIQDISDMGVQGKGLLLIVINSAQTKKELYWS